MSSTRKLLEYWGNKIVDQSEREEIYSPDGEFYDISMEVVDDGVQTPARTKYLYTPICKQFVTRSRLHVDSQPYNVKVELPYKHKAAHLDDEIPLRVSDSDLKIRTHEMYSRKEDTNGIRASNPPESQNVLNPSRGNNVSLSANETPLPLPSTEKLESHLTKTEGDDNVLCNISRCSNGCCTNDGHVTSEAEESRIACNSVPHSRSSGRCIKSGIHKSNCTAYDSSDGDFNDALTSAIEYEAFEGTWSTLRSEQDLPQTNTEKSNQKESKGNDTRSSIDNLTRTVKSLQESVDTVVKLSTENTRQINLVIVNMKKTDRNTTYRAKHQTTRANPIECYTGRGLGHMSRDCPEKKNPNRPNSILVVGTVSQQSEETAVENEQNTESGVYGSSGNTESESNWLGSWSVEQLREFQQNDPCIGLVLKLKEEGGERTLPSQLVGERQEAKFLLRQWTSLEVQDGLLYKRWETTHNHLKPYQSDKIPDCWNLPLNANKESSDNIEETGSDYTEEPNMSAESEIHDSYFGMNFCHKNVPSETDQIDLRVNEDELTDFLAQEGIQEDEKGFRIPVTMDGISCPIEGCQPCMYRNVRKYIRHWEEIHRAIFTFRICPICRQTFKRPSDLRRLLRRLHNLDPEMTETLVAKSKMETRANKHYIDPGFFLPPRVKDKPSGSIVSSSSSTLPSSSSIIVPQSSFSKGGPASCNNTCSILFLLPLAKEVVQLPVSLQLSSVYDISVPPLPSVRENIVFSNNQTPSAPERCVYTVEEPYNRPLVIPPVPSSTDKLNAYISWIKESQDRLTDALKTALTRLATIDGENKVTKEKDARRLLEQENRRLRAALYQKDWHDYSRLNVNVPRDEVVELEEIPDGTLRAVKRLKTGALPFTDKPTRYRAKPYTIVQEE
ncbi:hypothetical protein ACJMK2_002120 [Sinanodonta woodiana]|uniref:C2H2-type domain-containing protein n=1 Tax=Sinanodonta woodiana TaxID=1069815 RepID=A0ABD3XXG0_SINWO